MFDEDDSDTESLLPKAKKAKSPEKDKRTTGNKKRTNLSDEELIEMKRKRLAKLLEIDFTPKYKSNIGYLNKLKKQIEDKKKSKQNTEKLKSNPKVIKKITTPPIEVETTEMEKETEQSIQMKKRGNTKKRKKKYGVFCD